MTDNDLTFPILGFDMQGRIDGFRNRGEFTLCGSIGMNRNSHAGMTIFDASGRTFIVDKVRDLGIIDAGFRKLIRILLRYHVHRIAHDLTEAPPIPLAHLKERVCQSIASHPDDWRDDEAIVGESGPPIEESVLLEALQNKVRSCISTSELVNLLELGGSSV